MANPAVQTVTSLPYTFCCEVQTVDTWWVWTLPKETSQIVITVSDAEGGQDLIYYSFDSTISNEDSISTPVGVTDGTVSNVGVWQIDKTASGNFTIDLKQHGPARPTSTIQIALGSDSALVLGIAVS